MYIKKPPILLAGLVERIPVGMPIFFMPTFYYYPEKTVQSYVDC